MSKFKINKACKSFNIFLSLGFPSVAEYVCSSVLMWELAIEKVKIIHII